MSKEINRPITFYCIECGQKHPYVDVEFKVYGRCECSDIPTMWVRDKLWAVEYLEMKRMRTVMNMLAIMECGMTEETAQNFPRVVDAWIKAQKKA